MDGWALVLPHVIMHGVELTAGSRLGGVGSRMLIIVVLFAMRVTVLNALY